MKLKLIVSKSRTHLFLFVLILHTIFPVLGKVESSPRGQPTTIPYSPSTNKNMDYLPWHAHITALTVAPHCRRLGHARKLSEYLERVGDREEGWFVDLFVRCDNTNAITLYEGMG